MIAKINKLFVLFVAIAVLVVIGILVLPKFFAGQQNNQVGCTTETKICPDGSLVGRTGANCEFAKCSEAQTTPQVLAFGSAITVAVGKQIIFADGLTVMLTQINDSRCKQGVVCIWAGELSPVFTVFGGSMGTAQEVRLGTQTVKQVTKNGYTFELKNTKETSVTIVITKESKPQGICYIGGCSGEICSPQQGMTSSCIYQAKYACYKSATCARQSDGQCGWTQTPALTACLNINK